MDTAQCPANIYRRVELHAAAASVERGDYVLQLLWGVFAGEVAGKVTNIAFRVHDAKR